MPADVSIAICDSVRDRLGGIADGSAVLDRDEHRHVDSCLRCQADLVQYRRLLRALRTMRTEKLEPAPGLLPELLASIEHAAERHAIRSVLSGRKVAYIGGIAAATAAAGAGALVLASRSRGRRVA